MNDPSLSYVMTTRNRLPLLRVVLSRLIEHRSDDEEILVVDGASTDGTAGYLSDLLERGLIQHFSSQPDHGEAHGLNRGIVQAKGRLIKVMSDDDAYYWKGIEACKDFMLEHEEVDVLGSNGGGTDWALSDPFARFDYEQLFLRWQHDHSCFGFCGLGLMIRRDSLPLVGLFNPAFVRVDMEFALRITQGPCRLAWHLGCDYLRIGHDQSNGIAQKTRLAEEAAYMAAHEGTRTVRPRMPEAAAPQPYHRRLRSAAGRLRRRLMQTAVPTIDEPVPKMLSTSHGPGDWYKVFEEAERWLAECNLEPRGFLYEAARLSSPFSSSPPEVETER